jgi:hypothetical protein
MAAQAAGHTSAQSRQWVQASISKSCRMLKFVLVIF